VKTFNYSAQALLRGQLYGHNVVKPVAKHVRNTYLSVNPALQMINLLKLNKNDSMILEKLH